LRLKLTLALLILTAPFQGHAEKQVIPAGSLLQCTTSEKHISSKTVDVGDPVLCQVNRFTVYGHQVLPYGSYLSGTFEEYKDPGRLVGKGWMELKFDRLMVAPSTVIPVSAKVVDVPQYPVDKLGRIDGKGHAARDIFTWAIPILWPIDLLELPRRGPTPTLKSETRITVKIMDDVEVPNYTDEDGQPTLQRRAPEAYPQQEPHYYNPGPQSYYQQPEPNPYAQAYSQAYAQAYAQANTAPQVVYVQPQVVYAPPPVVYVEPQPVYYPIYPRRQVYTNRVSPYIGGPNGGGAYPQY
jgi:hypothetical protein